MSSSLSVPFNYHYICLLHLKLSLGSGRIWDDYLENSALTQINSVMAFPYAP